MRKLIMTKSIYESHEGARKATSDFYKSESGFSYSDETVDTWLDIYLTRALPKAPHILDLCCGDGVWSKGFKRIAPASTLYGIDISDGGIEKAKLLVSDDADNFVVGDAETELPWPDKTFDLIFARGPGLFNQHSMDRPGSIAVIEAWHSKLKKSGRMLSSFYADPQKFGTYTNPLEVALPYNRAPRLTPSVDFTGGKYHSDVQTFLTPFWKAEGVKVLDYRFIRNNHILLTVVDG